MMIIRLLKAFFLFASLADAARIIPERIRRLASHCRSFKNNIRIKATEMPNIEVNPSTVLTMTGIACTGIGLYCYNENQAFERRKLLRGEISKPDNYIRNLSNDPDFVREAFVKGGHKRLRLQILRCAPYCNFGHIDLYDSKTGRNLLVKLIERDESAVVLKLLEKLDIRSNVLAAINQKDMKSGKTPFMAAIESGNYELAGRMAYLGAIHPDPVELIESAKQDKYFVTMQILRYFPISSLDNIVIYNEETGQNLLVRLIENGLGNSVVYWLLQGPNIPKNVMAAINRVDLTCGKTPLLAAYERTSYRLARRLLHLGAEDRIILGSNPPKKVSDIVFSEQGYS